jgi:hypothetical protein
VLYDKRKEETLAKKEEWISEPMEETGIIQMSYGDFDPSFPDFVVEGGQFFYSADNIRLPNLEFQPLDFRLHVDFLDIHGPKDELDGEKMITTESVEDAIGTAT